MGMLLLLFPTVILYVGQVMFDISTNVTEEVTIKVSHTINVVLLYQTAISVQDVYHLQYKRLCQKWSGIQFM